MIKKVSTRFSLLSTGKLGGDVPLINTIPRINSQGTILLGKEYLNLFVELETPGLVYVCIEETSSNALPNSKQVFLGKNVFNKDCYGKNSTKVKYDFNHVLEPAMVRLSNLK